VIPEQLAQLLIKQINHNKRFGEFEFEYFGDSDVVNKLQINLVQKLEEWQTVNLGGQRHCKDFLPFFLYGGCFIRTGVIKSTLFSNIFSKYTSQSH